MLEQLQRMRQYFSSGATLSYEFRKEQLQKLKEALHRYEQEIYNSLYSDLKKKR